MAKVHNPTEEERKAYNDWVASRPDAVRMVAQKFDPWTLYRMRSTGQRVLVYSYGEGKDGEVKLTVVVLGTFNLIAFDRRVFGIDPGDLSECELPGPDEPVGATMTQAQVTENIDEIRLRVRPDLWMRMPDGSVVRKGTN